MNTNVLEVTPEDLRVMIDDMVEEKLASIFGDLDEGLELTDGLKARLLRQKKETENGERGESLENVVLRLGLQ